MARTPMMSAKLKSALGEAQAYDIFEDRATFEYKYSIRPRRCYSTGQWIWGLAMRGRLVITGPGSDVVEDRWYHRHEAIMKMLRKV